jgi:hypothetical protein
MQREAGRRRWPRDDDGLEPLDLMANFGDGSTVVLLNTISALPS